VTLPDCTAHPAALSARLKTRWSIDPRRDFSHPAAEAELACTAFASPGRPSSAAVGTAAATTAAVRMSAGRKNPAQSFPMLFITRNTF
jgi:hypothetical protein